MPPDLPGLLDLAELVDRVHRSLVDADTSAVDAEQVADRVRRQAPLLSARAIAEVVTRVTNRMVGLGSLQPFIDDDSVSEIMVNGPGPVWIERGGELVRTSVELGQAEVDLLVERIVAPAGRRADPRAPLVDLRLADGSRVNVVVRPLAVDGPCVTIRRFRARPVDLDDLCPPGVADLLRWAVRGRSNLVVIGGTGAGKTTVLNALGAVLAPGERIVTVEDAAELRLPGDHVVRLEGRPESAEGLGEVRLRDLVRNALRMRPDRILVGEVRGAEALDMLQAMNTGHEGSMSTCHANGPLDALHRLETLALQADVDLPLEAIRNQLHRSVDLLVHVSRAPGGTRQIIGVAEVAPEADDRPRVQLLADATGLRALPGRPARHSSVGPPLERWISS